MANPLYEIAIRVGIDLWLRSQAKKYPPDSPEARIAAERGQPLPDLDLPVTGPVYWLHAVSMGEVGVAAILGQELKRQCPEAVLVVSTSTATGLEAAQTKLPEADAVIAARFDARRLVSSMFDRIRPTALILVEGDLWRNLIAVARRRDVPVFVANAKLSERSLRAYRRFPAYARSLLSRLARVYAQTDLYRDRFVAAGLPADHCDVLGNVKLDVVPPVLSDAERADILQTAGCTDAAPIITFGSLHPGEETVALRGMQEVWRQFPNAHALVAPRHIDKTPQFAQRIQADFGLSCRLYSQPASGIHSRVTLVDRMGLLMKLYALADVCIVGGAFVPEVGGHNLTEPCFYAKPVLYGPHVHTQLGLHDLLMAHDAARQTAPEDFPAALAALVQAPAKARRLGQNGLQMIQSAQGSAARLMGDILARTSEAPVR